jgi:hypothetical protein
MHLRIAKFSNFGTTRSTGPTESEARKKAASIKPLTAAEFEVRSHEFGIRWAFAQTKSGYPGMLESRSACCRQPEVSDKGHKPETGGQS